MQGKNRKKLLHLALLLFLLGGCKTKDDTILYLNFDEGKGNTVSDQTGIQEDAQIQYRYQNAVYKEKEEPQWRTRGIQRGSLLFDGNSNYIAYDKKKVCLEGETLTIEAWVAPRAFEWDAPEAKSKNEQSLTAIVSQQNKKKKQGILLGYQRFGQLCFEVGTEDGWHTVWGDADLKKGEWNYVAAVYDGVSGEISLYLNGELTGSEKIPAGTKILGASNQDLLIGKNAEAQAIAAGTYNMFSGLMDELKISTCAKTKEECSIQIKVPEIDYEDLALVDILGDDCYKTQYHGGPYQHWMNEPHAPIYYNGTYHLFFQQNMVGTYWRNINWGHLVSDDLINWHPVKEALCATRDTVVPDGVWSGNACYDKNGVPLLFFTAGNDSYQKEGLLSNQNIGVAYPKNLEDKELIEWEISDKLAVKQEAGQGGTGEFRDPYIWKDEDGWSMLICSGSTKTEGGAVLLYQTKTLELLTDGTLDMDWEYQGVLYEMENPTMTYGTSWELPILLSLSNEAGTVQKHALLISPAPASTADNKVYFFLGNFDSESKKFIPDVAYAQNPKLLDYGDNVFTGPSVMFEEESGTYYMFSIMQDKRNGAEEGMAGWAHCVGLTREIYLSEDGTDLYIKPMQGLSKQEGEVLFEASSLTVEEANALLKQEAKKRDGEGEGSWGDMLHVEIEAELGTAEEFEIYVKSDGEKSHTSFRYEKGKIYGSTTDRGSEGNVGETGGTLLIKDGTLTMDVYIDRSLVEAYFNEEKAISVRSYTDAKAQEIEILAKDDVVIKKLRIASVKPI